MEYNILYKERKSKEQQEKKKKKELMCVYAYNDSGNDRKREQGMRGVGVRNHCDVSGSRGKVIVGEW